MRRALIRSSIFAATVLAGGSPAFSQVDDFEYDVDLELALAVDVSRSMDVEEQRIQREGYIAAFRHPDIIEAIQSGPLGRIAVTYFEWAGSGARSIVVPWTAISDAVDGEAFANLLEAAPRMRESGTSITGAMLHAGGLFGETFNGYRRTVDISGDGPNNEGGPVLAARDWLLRQSVTINGLPIMLNRVYGNGPFGIPNLDVYYEDCVVGGPGAFAIPVRSADEFAEAIRRKLILEIAGVEPRLMPAAEITAEPRIDCLIGEKSRRGMRFWDSPEQRSR